jgi:hypothetical protein
LFDQGAKVFRELLHGRKAGSGCIRAACPWEMAMEKFVHQKNLAHYRKLLAGTAHEPQRQQILALLAEEELREPLPHRQG